MKAFWATAFKAKNWRSAVGEIEQAYKGKEITVYPITVFWKNYWRVFCTA
jgi:hypothetical protein